MDCRNTAFDKYTNGCDKKLFESVSPWQLLLILSQPTVILVLGENVSRRETLITTEFHYG